MQRLSERASRDAGGEQLGLDGVAERAPADELLALSNWAGRTETGDRAELDVEPSAVAWSAVSVSARECPGAARCPSGNVCFAEGARLKAQRSEEHTSELQSLMRSSYAVFCLQKQTNTKSPR